MFKILFIALLTVGVTNLTYANNIWDDCTPLQLGVKIDDKPVTVKFITDPTQLSPDLWAKFKASLIAFYEYKWKDQNPKDLGIEGTLKAFLEKQYELNFNEFSTNPDACFLYLSSESESGESTPLLGIFCQKDMARFKGSSRGSIISDFLLRLLVCAEPEAMKTLPALAQALLSVITPCVLDHECTKFLTISRTNSPLENKMFMSLGFKEAKGDEITSELKELYDSQYYIFFEKTVE